MSNQMPLLLFDPEPGLLSVHIPKTGGNSIYFAVRHAMSAATLNRSSELQRQLVSCTIQWPKMANAAHWPTAYALGCIRQHLNITRPVIAFAVLRRPLDRRVSAYHWVKDWFARRKHVNYSQNFSDYIVSGDFRRYPPDNQQWGAAFGLPQVDFLSTCTVVFQFERMERVYTFLQRYYPTIQNEHSNAGVHGEVDLSDQAREVLKRVDADDDLLWLKLERAGGMLDPCRLISAAPSSIGSRRGAELPWSVGV